MGAYQDEAFLDWIEGKHRISLPDTGVWIVTKKFPAFERSISPLVVDAFCQFEVVKTRRKPSQYHDEDDDDDENGGTSRKEEGTKALLSVHKQALKDPSNPRSFSVFPNETLPIADHLHIWRKKLKGCEYAPSLIEINVTKQYVGDPCPGGYDIYILTEFPRGRCLQEIADKCKQYAKSQSPKPPNPITKDQLEKIKSAFETAIEDVSRRGIFLDEVYDTVSLRSVFWDEVGDKCYFINFRNGQIVKKDPGWTVQDFDFKLWGFKDLEEAVTE